MNNRLQLHGPQNGASPFIPKVELTVTGFRLQTEVGDGLLVEYVRGLPDEIRLSTCKSALDLGLRLLISQRNEAAIVHLTDQMDAAAKTVIERLGLVGENHAQQIRSLEATYLADDGKLTKAISGLGKELALQLDPENSAAMRALRQALVADLMKPAQKLLNEISGAMNVNNEGSAVGILNKKVTELAAALASLTAKVEDVMTLTATKRRDPVHAGASLEEFFFSVASPIAQACGDMLADTRALAGAIEGSKAGDYVTTLDTAVVAGQLSRFVVEAKNRISVNQERLASELDVAMRNRDANAAFGILTNPRAANEPCLSIHHGNKIIVCLPGFGSPACDPEVASVFVRAGYQLTRAIAIARTVGRGVAEPIDFASLKASCEEFNAVVKRFSNLAAAHTRVRSALENAENTADGIKAALVAAVDKFLDGIDAQAFRAAGGTAK
jgi:hypothetical protein